MPTVSPDVLKQVKAIELRTRGLVSTLFAGEYRSVFRGQGMEFAEVRAYEPGDDFRAIDWNVSARSVQTHVRESIADRELETWVLVDRSPSLDFGTARTTKAGLALEAVGAIGFLTARTGNRLGNRLPASVTPRSGSSRSRNTAPRTKNTTSAAMAGR